MERKFITSQPQFTPLRVLKYLYKMGKTEGTFPSIDAIIFLTIAIQYKKLEKIGKNYRISPIIYPVFLVILFIFNVSQMPILATSTIYLQKNAKNP